MTKGSMYKQERNERWKLKSRQQCQGTVLSKLTGALEPNRRSRKERFWTVFIYFSMQIKDCLNENFEHVLQSVLSQVPFFPTLTFLRIYGRVLIKVFSNLSDCMIMSCPRSKSLYGTIFIEERLVLVSSSWAHKVTQNDWATGTIQLLPERPCCPWPARASALPLPSRGCRAPHVADSILLGCRNLARGFPGRDFCWVRETWLAQDKLPWVSTMKPRVSEIGSGATAGKRYAAYLHIQIA